MSERLFGCSSGYGPMRGGLLEVTVSKRALLPFSSMCGADMDKVTGGGDGRTYKGNGRTLEKAVVVDGDGVSVWRSIE